MTQETNQDINKTEITVNKNGEVFVFGIPSLREEAKIASLVQAMIYEDCQNTNVVESSLPAVAMANYRTIATFKTLLRKSTAPWAWDNNNGKLIVKENLPSKAIEIYVDFVLQLQEFFQGGASSGDAPSQTPVASK